MIPPEHPRLRRYVSALLTLILAVWVGGSTIVDALVIPVALDELPRPHFADFGAHLFHRLNFIECLLGAVALLLAFAIGRRGWGSRLRHRLCTSLLLGMTLLVMLFLLWMTPAMLARVNELKSMGVDLSNPADLTPARLSFRHFHTVYAVLDVLKIVTGAVVLWLLASRRAR